MLRNRTVKMTGVDHWQTLPKPIAEGELDYLMEGLRQGNRESRNRLIEGHMCLARNLVGRYLTVLRSTTLKDELLSVAFAGLVDAVDKLRHDHPNPTAYITTQLHNHIQRRGINDLQSLERISHEPPFHDSRFLDECEEVNIVLKDDIDCVIVDLLMMGWTQRMIAERCKMTSSAINQRIKAIRTRYLERQDD